MNFWVFKLSTKFQSILECIWVSNSFLLYSTFHISPSRKTESICRLFIFFQYLFYTFHLFDHVRILHWILTMGEADLWQGSCNPQLQRLLQDSNFFSTEHPNNIEQDLHPSFQLGHTKDIFCIQFCAECGCFLNILPSDV